MAEEAVEEQKDGREGRQHRRIDPSRRVLGQRITRTINDSHCLLALLLQKGLLFRQSKSSKYCIYKT